MRSKTTKRNDSTTDMRLSKRTPSDSETETTIKVRHIKSSQNVEIIQLFEKAGENSGS
jgi:hypothetical protein